MPSIYTSFKIEPGDSIETRRRKLYLGIMSLGEQLYSFNAHCNELRREFSVLDEKYKTLKREYDSLRRA